MSELFTRAYWLDTLERVITTAAQTAIVGLGLGETTNAFEVDFQLLLGFAGGGALVALLTALAGVRRRSRQVNGGRG